jgi:hypothetical protein
MVKTLKSAGMPPFDGRTIWGKSPYKPPNYPGLTPEDLSIC